MPELDKLPTMTAPQSVATTKNEGGIIQQNKVNPQSYQEMYKVLSPFKPKTQEEIEQMRQAEKNASLFSAIGDSINALSNIYFTSQGAPNMFTPDSSMSERNRARWDKINQDYKANQRAYSEGLLRMKQLDEAQNARNEQMKLQKDQMQQSQAQFALQMLMKQKEQEEDRRRWQAQYDYKQQSDEADRAQKQSQFETEQNNRLKLANLQYGRYYKDNYLNFALDDGEYRVPKENFNRVNISRIFAMLPDEVKSKVLGAPIYSTETNALGEQVKVISGYSSPNEEDMLSAITANMDSYPDVLKEFKRLGTKVSSYKTEPKKEPEQPAKQSRILDPRKQVSREKITIKGW